MSTVCYACEECGDEIGSAQYIVWVDGKPYHPECEPIKEETDK